MIDLIHNDTMEVKDENGKSALNVVSVNQLSFSQDAIIATDYAQDYIVRGRAFQIRKRITIPGEETLYMEFDLTKATGPIFTLPVLCSTAGGAVFLDTYNADSSTGGTALPVLKLNTSSDNLPKITVKSGVTVSGTPENVREYIIGTLSTNQSSGGGLISDETPKVWANDKPLYFKFMNQETGPVVLNVGFVWFEL